MFGKKEYMEDICQQQCSHHSSMSVRKVKTFINVSAKDLATRCNWENTLNEQKVEKFIWKEHKSR